MVMHNNVDLKMVELIDEWLGIRFPNADPAYRSQWQNRFIKHGIEFSDHMDAESRKSWKKVYLNYLEGSHGTK